MAGVGTGRSDEGETLRAHRTVFFFKLEREIEKVSERAFDESILPPFLLLETRTHTLGSY